MVSQGLLWQFAQPDCLAEVYWLACRLMLADVQTYSMHWFMSNFISFVCWYSLCELWNSQTCFVPPDFVRCLLMLVLTGLVTVGSIASGTLKNSLSLKLVPQGVCWKLYIDVLGAQIFHESLAKKSAGSFERSGLNAAPSYGIPYDGVAFTTFMSIRFM